MEVSTICQGCWSLVSNDPTWGPTDEADAFAAIHASLDAGVNFFDTAPGYGHGESESILGRVLSGNKDVIVASKITPNNLTADRAATACDASLQRLGRDHIDLYQIHWPNPNVPLAETFGALEELVTAGKVRAVGVSNFGMSYLRELPSLPMAAGPAAVQCNQLNYSLLFRAIEFEIQPACQAQQMDILCYSPLAQGLLTGKFATVDDVPDTRNRTRLFRSDRPNSRHGEPGCEEEVFTALAEIRKICEELGEPMSRVALAWCLHQQGVASVVVGGRSAEQALQNARAGDLRLDEATVSALTAVTEPVKDILGPNADIWEHNSRMER